MAKKEKTGEREGAAIAAPATDAVPAKTEKVPKQPPKKTKKNPADRQQPAWLFPPDDENPILNPRAKSKEQVDKETAERLEAIKFLKHKAVTAPVRPPPPGRLLQLVGAFLTFYGFNSTSRLFTLERNARKKLDGWTDEIGKKFEKGMPNLLRIYQAWEREWELAQAEEKAAKGGDDTSSEGSEDDGSESEEEVPKKKKGKKVAKKPTEDDSDPSDSSSSDDESDDSDGGVATKVTTSKGNTSKASQKRKLSRSSSDDSDLDSDALAPKPQSPKKKVKLAPVAGRSVQAPNPVITPAAASKVTGGLKHEKVQGKKAVGKKAAAPLSSSDSSESAEGSDSSGASDSNAEEVESKSNDTTNHTTSSDSSVTLNGTVMKDTEMRDASSVSSKEEDKVPSKDTVIKVTKKSSKAALDRPADEVVKKTKGEKKQSIPFSRIPKDTKVDPRLASNQFVPYDYAEKAHQDLIVTKGKDFTKEKNKKKRGS